jgi:hypothetical protein
MATGSRALPQQPGKKKGESSRLEEQIRKRAHEIYLQRGEQAGSELDDWLQAEAEIRAQQGKAS